MQDEPIWAPEGSDRWIIDIAEVLLTQQDLAETLVYVFESL
jgi:hypothetical protein